MHGTWDHYPDFPLIRNIENDRECIWNILYIALQSNDLILVLALPFPWLGLHPLSPYLWLCGYSEITMQMVNNILEDILRAVLPTFAC